MALQFVFPIAANQHTEITKTVQRLVTTPTKVFSQLNV